MSAFATCNGVRIVSGAAVFPMYGIWTASLLLAGPDTMTAAAAIVIGALTLAGTVYRTAPFAGSRHVLVVGGKGGWRHALAERQYTMGSVMLSLVLGDAAIECGETLSLSGDVSLGSTYTRPAGTGGELLRALAPLWWMDTNGITQVKGRPGARIGSPFTVEDWDGSAGAFSVATEAPQDWMPGNTFSGPTVPTAQQISLSRIVMENSGRVRVRALTTGAAVQ